MTSPPPDNPWEIPAQGGVAILLFLGGSIFIGLAFIVAVARAVREDLNKMKSKRHAAADR